MKNIDGFTRGMIRRICFATIMASVLLASSCKKEIEPTLKERQNAPKESALSRWLATTDPEWIPFVLNRARPKNGAAEGEGAVSDLLKSLMTIDKAEKYYRAQLLREGYRPAELDSLLLSPAGKGPSLVSEALFVSYISIGQTATMPRGAWPDGKGGYLDEVEIRACRVPSDIQLFQRVVGGPPNQVFDPRIQRSPAELCKQRAMSNLSMLYNELRNKHNPSDMECNRIQMDIQRLMQEYFACDMSYPTENPPTPLNLPSGRGGNGTIAGEAIPDDPYIPGQDKSPINPKKYKDCFNNIPNAGASYKVIVQVEEPVPGTRLNYDISNPVNGRGVGHTAITVTKTGANGVSVTQTVGFYPAEGGTGKLKGPSKMVDNAKIGDTEQIQFTVSMEFDLGNNTTTFNKILESIANPPAEYNLFGMNCTAFVVERAEVEGSYCQMQ